MIAIIRSKRYEELLQKEKAADAIDDEALLVAAWKSIPDVDVSAELNSLNETLAIAWQYCDRGSPLQSRIEIARASVRQLFLAVA